MVRMVSAAALHITATLCNVVEFKKRSYRTAAYLKKLTKAKAK